MKETKLQWFLYVCLCVDSLFFSSFVWSWLEENDLRFDGSFLVQWNEFARAMLCVLNAFMVTVTLTDWIMEVFCLQHVDHANSYLCGYLKIKGLTEEFPTLTTFFDGEIISKKHPFLTRKWDADEDVDRKHWVRVKDSFSCMFALFVWKLSLFCFYGTCVCVRVDSMCRHVLVYEYDCFMYVHMCIYYICIHVLYGYIQCCEDTVSAELR